MIFIVYNVQVVLGHSYSLKILGVVIGTPEPYNYGYKYANDSNSSEG